MQIHDPLLGPGFGTYSLAGHSRETHGRTRRLPEPLAVPMLVHKVMLILHREGSGCIFAITQGGSFTATCPRTNSPQLPAKAVPCRAIFKGNTVPQGVENPSTSMRSRWHVLRVPPEPLCCAQIPASLCQGKGSAAERGRLTGESMLRKDRRVCACCYMPAFYKGETVMPPPTAARVSPWRCIGDCGRLTTPAYLRPIAAAASCSSAA